MPLFLRSHFSDDFYLRLIQEQRQIAKSVSEAKRRLLKFGRQLGRIGPEYFFRSPLANAINSVNQRCNVPGKYLDCRPEMYWQTSRSITSFEANFLSDSDVDFVFSRSINYEALSKWADQ